MIHAISSYGPQAASTRVRLMNWFQYLNISPIYHQYANLSANRPRSVLRAATNVARAEIHARHLDLTNAQLIISREASPFSNGSLESRYLRRAKHGVYDFDDALFDDPSPIRRAFGQRDKCQKTVVAADVVIAGNDYLANWASGLNGDIRVIPSCVEPSSYTPKFDWSITGSKPVLVWLGSPATEHYVAQIAQALIEVNRRTGAELVLISGRVPSAPLKQLRGIVRRVPWDLSTFADVLASADVAIAPLDGGSFSRGKCAFKLLQYAATGLPMIGSPVGANQLALTRFDGIAVRSLHEWIIGLTDILNESAQRRQSRGQSALRAVRAHYSFAAWEASWTAATDLKHVPKS